MPPPETAVLRVLVADDNPVVRAGLTALLTSHEDITVVAQASEGREAQEAAHRHRPDVILLDVHMPGVDGLTALPYLAPLAPVLMLTYSGDAETTLEALRRGAAGYLVHGEFTVDQLLTAVRDASRGRPHTSPTATEALLGHLRSDGSATAHGNAAKLTQNRGVYSSSSSQLQHDVGHSTPLGAQLSAREAEIMDLIATGLTNQQIAAACFISEKTVKNHINRIFAKLHSTSRAEATAKWLGTAPRECR
ncbi:response regulator transcription factor [Streptomyces sp. NPDC049915]|uniref:response regulator transcription factor n=1 Tax=Streptomyces sp. NPDC049915 TaxID=3155510 RepID=UPI0034346DBF